MTLLGGPAPHQLRHAHTLELAREGVPLNVIQRQLGHSNLGTTSIYLQGIDIEAISAQTEGTTTSPPRLPSSGVGTRRARTVGLAFVHEASPSEVRSGVQVV
ncbi:MAG: site-specific integrase [Solirubrobacteraceae bacterium]